MTRRIFLALGVTIAFLAPFRSPATPPADTIRVMTFNIRYGTAEDGLQAWNARRDLLLFRLSADSADVIGLQEALRFQIDEIRSAVPGYAEVGAGRDDGKSAGEHSQILFRSARFRFEAGGTFWLSDTPEVPGSITWGNACTRICTWARLFDTRDDRSVYVYNLHLDHVSQRSRELGVQLVMRRITGRATKDPVILMGDFNTGEKNPVIPYITGTDPLFGHDSTVQRNPSPLVDTYASAHPGESEVATYHAFKGGIVGERIDYIFASPGTEVLGSSIDRAEHAGIYPSDHYPVVSTLLFP
jgi:endonuclease/exonuclease/phosphatase family metal-dependent hydrolase